MTTSDLLLQSYRDLAVRSDLTALVMLALGLVVTWQALAFSYRVWMEALVDIPYRITHGHGIAALFAVFSLSLFALSVVFSAAASMELLGLPLPAPAQWSALVDARADAGAWVLGWLRAPSMQPSTLGWLALGLSLNVAATLIRVVADTPRRRIQAQRAKQLLERLSTESDDTAPTPRSIVKYR